GVNIMDTCQKLGIPLVVYFLGYDGTVDWVLKKYGHRYHEFNTKAKAVIGVSKDMMNLLEAQGISRSLMHYNPCGPNNVPEVEALPAQNPPHFVAVAGFVEKKGYAYSIKAFAKVVAKYPEARLSIVGNGLLLTSIKTLVHELGLEKQVVFHGRLTIDEITTISRGARAFIQHSVIASNGDREGTPVAILEAGLLGLPVISTRHAGIPEVILDGITGLLVEERDIQGMADAMEVLIEDPDKAGQIGKAARKHVLREFNQEKLINNLWRILSS
ncbi:MAG: glycosyltransferase, partial [Bacteroidia bacterium]